MPTIDWIHVAMFILGLALQWLSARSGTPIPFPPMPSPQQQQQPPAIDANMLLSLAHKLLDERRQATKT